MKYKELCALNVLPKSVHPSRIFQFPEYYGKCANFLDSVCVGEAPNINRVKKFYWITRLAILCCL